MIIWHRLILEWMMQLRKKQKEPAMLGISMSTVINIFLEKVGNERRIPFEVTADPSYDRDNKRNWKEELKSKKWLKITLKEHELIEVD